MHMIDSQLDHWSCQTHSAVVAVTDLSICPKILRSETGMNVSRFIEDASVNWGKKARVDPYG